MWQNNQSLEELRARSWCLWWTLRAAKHGLICLRPKAAPGPHVAEQSESGGAARKVMVFMVDTSSSEAWPDLSSPQGCTWTSCGRTIRVWRSCAQGHGVYGGHFEQRSMA